MIQRKILLITTLISVILIVGLAACNKWESYIVLEEIKTEK